MKLSSTRIFLPLISPLLLPSFALADCQQMLGIKDGLYETSSSGYMSNEGFSRFRSRTLQLKGIDTTVEQCALYSLGSAQEPGDDWCPLLRYFRFPDGTLNAYSGLCTESYITDAPASYFKQALHRLNKAGNTFSFDAGFFHGGEKASLTVKTSDSFSLNYSEAGSLVVVVPVWLDSKYEGKRLSP